jgi:hypothetical protein
MSKLTSKKTRCLPLSNAAGERTPPPATGWERRPSAGPNASVAALAMQEMLRLWAGHVLQPATGRRWRR